jgi:hypothetical protein
MEHKDTPVSPFRPMGISFQNIGFKIFTTYISCYTRKSDVVGEQSRLWTCGSWGCRLIP